ncbi:MAG: TIGR02147 family protein [Bdellovibrionaceae bacterium]|nr:TIGR02147 family protein [Bdellovibrio sp.]
MNIFEFTHFRDYLSTRIFGAGTDKREAHLGQIAKSLGYKSASLLSMVLSGKRLPSSEMVDGLMDTWNLSAKERAYFRLLVQLAKTQSKGKDTSSIVLKIKRHSQTQVTHLLNDLEFTAIKEWHYTVIKQLVESPNFREDPKWISQTLRKKITPGQATQALKVLEEQKLITRDPITNKLSAPNFIETTHDIPSAAIRQHHHGMLARAAEALEEQGVPQKQFNSLTFKVDPEKLPEMKEKILSFIKQLYADYDAPLADSVYQLNLQLFEHTQKRKENLDGTH